MVFTKILRGALPLIRPSPIQTRFYIWICTNLLLFPIWYSLWWPLTKHSTIGMKSEVWKVNHCSMKSHADLRQKAENNWNPFLERFTVETDDLEWRMRKFITTFQNWKGECCMLFKNIRHFIQTTGAFDIKLPYRVKEILGCIKSICHNLYVENHIHI